MNNLNKDAFIEKSFYVVIDGNQYYILDAACGNKYILEHLGPLEVFSIFCHAIDQKDFVLTVPLLMSKVDFCKKLLKAQILSLFSKVLERANAVLVQAFLKNKYFLSITSDAIEAGNYNLVIKLINLSNVVDIQGILFVLLQCENLWPEEKKQSKQVKDKVQKLLNKVEKLFFIKKSPAGESIQHDDKATLKKEVSN